MPTPPDEQMAYLERHVEQLDEAVRELFVRIEAIERDVARLRSETKQAFADRDESEEQDDG